MVWNDKRWATAEYWAEFAEKAERVEPTYKESLRKEALPAEVVERRRAEAKATYQRGAARRARGVADRAAAREKERERRWEGEGKGVKPGRLMAGDETAWAEGAWVRVAPGELGLVREVSSLVPVGERPACEVCGVGPKEMRRRAVGAPYSFRTVCNHCRVAGRKRAPD